MASTKPESADTTNMTDNVDDVSVNSASTTTETEYQMNWNKWNGYYKSIPEIQAVIDKKALWTVGKGYKAKDGNKAELDKIRGFGKDSFNAILYNMCRVYTIGGDSYAEIISNSRGTLRNLKPLNPGSIKIIANGNGIITRYEQWNNGTLAHKFNPDEIFHLCWNRQADAIHGISTIEKIENIILMRNESMSDLKMLFHRYVKPLIISAVDTDDETEIANYKAKLDNAVKNGENMVVPKGVLDKMERMSIPQYSTLDPMPWLDLLQAQFLAAEGVPSVILGNGTKDTTEATAKILYLAFQQMIEWNQLFIEEQCNAQLGIEIELNFPASIAPDLMANNDKAKKTNNMEMGVNENK